MQKLKIRDSLRPGEACQYASLDIDSPKVGELRAPMHTHDFPEVFWVEDGAGQHWINGGQRTLRAGLLALIRPSDAHAIVVEACRRWRMVNVSFPADVWNRLCGRYFPGGRNPWRSRPYPEREYELSAAAMLDVQRAAAELATGARGRRAIDRFLLNLCHVLEQAEQQAAASAIPDWLAKACREIGRDRNFAGGTPVFARLAGRSAEHVAREARRLLGKTPTQLVNEARMVHAALRLAQTQDQIIEISLDCGFTNLSHFHKMFRKHHGVTPRTFRLQQQLTVPRSKVGRR